MYNKLLFSKDNLIQISAASLKAEATISKNLSDLGTADIFPKATNHLQVLIIIENLWQAHFWGHK